MVTTHPRVLHLVLHWLLLQSPRANWSRRQAAGARARLPQAVCMRALAGVRQVLHAEQVVYRGEQGRQVAAPVLVLVPVEKETARK